MLHKITFEFLLHYLRILLYLNDADDIADVYNLICIQALGKYLLNVSDVTLFFFMIFEFKVKIAFIYILTTLM